MKASLKEAVGRLTLVMYFVSKGFPYKDQIEESFIVMVYLCIPNT